MALALRPATEQALVERLGSTTGLARLHQPESADTACGQTAAGRRAMELREITATTGGPVTVLAEHTSRLDGVDGGFWTELDAALNIALADLPVARHVLLPRAAAAPRDPRRRPPQPPALLMAGQLRHNPDHIGPREVLTARPAPPPVLLGPPDLRMEFSAWQLHEVRTAVEQALEAADYGRERAEDVVLAVNEVATNAVEHGTPEARLSVWAGPAGWCARSTTAAPCATLSPGCRHRIRPSPAAAVCGSRGRSATPCTCGPTNAAPMSECMPPHE